MRATLLLLAIGCGSPAAAPDAAVDANGNDKSANCASTFGNALTNAFGRLDGTVVAIVEPGNMRCAMPNSTHVVVQVMSQGAVYRMVANVLSTSADPHVWLGATDHALVGEAWSEGWHPDEQLDYALTLGVGKGSFTQADEATAVARIVDGLTIGAHVSVYATSSGGAQADSAHLIHRNSTNADGAIVVDPETAPHYLLTAFPEQSF